MCPLWAGQPQPDVDDDHEDEVLPLVPAAAPDAPARAASTPAATPQRTAEAAPPRFSGVRPISWPFKANDRVAFIGSSSTRIGVWCKTMEFLLRSRHPELKLTFARHTTGGGSFQTGIKNMPMWLKLSEPTLVLFNYGGNDSAAGYKGIPKFLTNLQQAVDMVRAEKARVVLMTHQSNDIRLAKGGPFANRRIYYEAMSDYCRDRGLDLVDTHAQLETLQYTMQAERPEFTINIDQIHLSDSAYVAWGYYLYERCSPPAAESLAEVSADGRPGLTLHCTLTDIQALPDGVSFARTDDLLPLLPPDPLPEPAAALKKTFRWKVPEPMHSYLVAEGSRLPPRRLVPLEKLSRYMLKVTGLAAGDYEIACEGKRVGTASARELADGVNLNSLWLDLTKGKVLIPYAPASTGVNAPAANSSTTPIASSTPLSTSAAASGVPQPLAPTTAKPADPDAPYPWEALTRELWEGKTDALGKAKLNYTVRRISQP